GHRPRIQCCDSRHPQRRPRWPPPSPWRPNGGSARRSARFAPTRRAAEKRGPRDGELKQLTACIDKGIASVAPKLDEVKGYVNDLRRIHDTLDPTTGSTHDRQ